MPKLSDLASFVAPIPIPTVEGAYIPSDFGWGRVGDTPAALSDLMAKGDDAILAKLMAAGCIVDEDGAPFEDDDITKQPPGRKQRLVGGFIDATLAGGIPFPRMPNRPKRAPRRAKKASG